MDRTPHPLTATDATDPASPHPAPGCESAGSRLGVAELTGTGKLRRDGYARLGATDLGIDADELAGDLAELARAFEHLPRDPHAPESNRFRRYSHAVYLSWTDELSFIPGTPDDEYGTVSEFWQDEHNPEFPDARRKLPDLTPDLRDNRLVRAIIRADLAEALWLEQLRTAPVYLAVHMIRLAVRDRTQVAVSSPNCLHQDGGSPALCTFAHLVDRRNITGGENVIAVPGCAGRQPDDLAPEDIHARFVLSEPLDGYGVHDHSVSHYVAPVHLADHAGSGHRDIFIVGIAPFTPGL
ncbi:2OG-Fe dioxygenase family protein [Streptomyces sp. NRRL B-3648]|uniref:2OG-Fe dioxygenase family protein n=1 Tax=Streptomyces sp. NRRL B-3648 TaxID=1519493 RepID=UPI0006AF6177|nr:2OG-Fe dioxygenase family protein [Streptomyces sp. NRRL B-3648]